MSFEVEPVHRPATNWASDLIQVDRIKLVSNNAWAATYCLFSKSHNHYLKILPEAARGAVPRIAQIAAELKDNVPKVLATDSQNGWILFADHGGHTIDSDDELTKAAEQFAMIQARAHRSSSLQAVLERIDIRTLPQNLMDFLTSPTATSGEQSHVGAAYFIGHEAVRYASLLRDRLQWLTPWIDQAATMPHTLCHGDLQPRNIAVTPAHRVVFFDWDDASWGPAGMCLPGLFSRCTLASMLVNRWATSGSAGDSSSARCLQAYVKTLVDAGYANENTLLSGLIGSMSAGRMRFVVSFGHHPSNLHHEACGETIRACLTDLLDLCDWLSTRVPGAAMANIDQYERQAEWDRALRLVEDQLSRQTEDVALLIRYANLACELGDLEAAGEAANKALGLEPQNVLASLAMARTLWLQLELSPSASLLSKVLQIEPDNLSARTLLSQVNAFAAIQTRSAQPDAVPRVALSSQAQSSGCLEPQTLELMLTLFKRYGVLQVDNVFSRALIERLQKSFAAKYEGHYLDGAFPEALAVGDKRFMLTLDLDDEFGDPTLIASTLVLPFMDRVLGSERILSAYTAVVSLPGSQEQGIHKDHPALFEEYGWNLEHPSFAVQVVVPLIALDEETGTTRVFKGSQRLSANDVTELSHQDPTVPLGSCLLIDYAVAHAGRSNRSSHARPILNLVFSRPWFRDTRNYRHQPPLRISQAYWNGAPDSVKDLVKWWVTEPRAGSQS